MKGKKLLSVLLMLAIAGTATSAITLAACKKKNNGNNGDNGDSGIVDGGDDNGDTKVGGTTYYVSTTGKSVDEAAGTKEDPWKLSEALGLSSQELLPGDTIRVMPGVYNELAKINIVASGTYDHYVTIMADDPTQETVISFYGMVFHSTSRGVEVYANYMHWNGIDIRGAGDNGMYIGGSYNIIENSRFYDNRDTGLQLGRSYSPTNNSYQGYNDIEMWPSYNLIKNCTSFNNYDNESYGENADGFAAKLTIGYGNVFDGCIAYRNSDDGWDLFAKTDSGNIGEVILYNCVAFENGFLMETQEEFNKKFPEYHTSFNEANTKVYTTRDGDGNGFKLGGSVMEGEVLLHNVLSFNNRMHGITDNSNPGVIIVDGATCYNNGACVDENGKITYTYDKNNKAMIEPTDSANIDLARQTYSYNHIANALSIQKDSKLLKNDAYRGTAENCSFLAIDDNTKEYKSYLVEGQAEYNSKKGDRGKPTTLADANALFETLPELTMGVRKNEAGTSWYDWHTALRNADGSINMGKILALKNAEGTKGSKVNLSSWEDYDHYGIYNFKDCKSTDEAVAQAVIDMTYVPIRPEALYQNFNVISRIKGVNITWTSNNTKLLNVAGSTPSSNSNHQAKKIEVVRPDDKDTEVTLTASVTVGSVTKTRDFKINVKRNTYRVTPDGIVIDGLKDGALIIDKAENPKDFYYPTPVVLNDTSDSGALISTQNYEPDTRLRFAPYSDPENFKDVSLGDWDATRAGIWEVKVIIDLKESVEMAKKGDGSFDADGNEVMAPQTITKTYYLYIAEDDAENYFRESSYAVNKDGFIISGKFNSPTGNLYAVTKTAGEKAPTTAEEIKNDANVQKYEAFRTTGGEFQFTQANSGAYTIYYFVEDIDGTKPSEIYKNEVSVVKISTKAQFESMLSSNDTHTLYLLQNDIDMSGSIKLVGEKQYFVGLFNGNGHKLSNININQTDKGVLGLFTTVKGGTIMNVNFEDVTIQANSASEKIGLIGQVMGGYIYNVSIHNIDVNKDNAAAKRVGGLIGQVTSDSNSISTLYIERVSVVNDAERDEMTKEATEYKYAIRGNERVGGLIGYIQNGSGTSGCKIYIDNCFVDVQVESVNYSGGFIGRMNDISDRYTLEITRSYSAGFTIAGTYCSGILGGFDGSGHTRIISCVSTGKLFYTAEREELLVAVKNGSHITGKFPTNGDVVVLNCYAPFIDYNANYLVTAFNVWDDLLEARFPEARSKDFWEPYLTIEFGGENGLTQSTTVWDFENDWEFEDMYLAYLEAPYVHLVMA